MVGIDLSRVTAGVAQSRANGIMVACVDARALPFADETFDVIVSNSTLEHHFRSRKKLIASMRELNRATAARWWKLVLTLDNRANPVGWLCATHYLFIGSIIFVSCHTMWASLPRPAWATQIARGNELGFA